MKFLRVNALLAVMVAGAITMGCSNSIGTVGTEAATGVVEVVTGEEEIAVSPEDYDFHDYVKLGQYTGFVIDVPIVSVTDADVQSSLESLQATSTSYEELDKKVVESGDYASITLSAVDSVGTALDDYSVEETELRVGSESLFGEIDQALIGMAVGDTKEVSVTVADDYFDQSIAGTVMVFTVTLNSIDKQVVPELNDEFIQGISEYGTIEEWKAAKKEELITQSEDEQESIFRSSLQKRIISNAVFEELPEELVYGMMSRYRSDDEQSAAAMGYTFEELLTEYYGYTGEDEYTEDLHSYVVQSIKLSFTLSALQEAERISITAEELEAFEEACVEYYGFNNTDELIDYYGNEVVEAAALNDKIYEVVGALSEMNPTKDYAE